MSKQINPLKKSDIDNLQQSRKKSWELLKPHRENQKEAVRQYVGSHYSDNGAKDKVPVNLMELAVNIYLQHLAAQCPEVLVTTVPRELKATAFSLEIDTNNLLKKLKFEEVMAEIVLQAMFSVGIAKTGLNQGNKIMIDGQYYDLGRAATASVSLDHWVMDMLASRWDQMQYLGDRYCLPFDHVKDSDYFTKKFRDKLTPADGPSADGNDSEKTSAIAQGEGRQDDRYKEVIWLWDFYLPMENLFITVADDEVDEVGAIIDWNGRRGPYSFLSFNKVIDNIMPLAPAALWMDLHNLTNKLFRKLGRQATRQKTLTGVQAGADEDGKRVVNANDGDVIRLDNPAATKEFKTGGIDQFSLLFLLQVKDLAVYLMGNLDSLGGLSKMADTLGQDQLLDKNASKRLESMGVKTVNCATELIKDLAWYRYTNPVEDFRVVKNKYGVEIPTKFTAAQRQATDFFEYAFQILPYSMQHQTPESKLASLTGIFERFVAPFAPMFLQQGITIDFESLFKTISRYGNLPELNDILIYANPQHPERGIGGEAAPRQSPVTTRRYIRENRPGTSRQGKDAALSQLLGGSKGQPAENAQLMRT